MKYKKITPFSPRRWVALWACLGSVGLAAAQTDVPIPSALSEKDYLADMPIVLSVSRLPQRLDETPGAVTLIDRDTIRRSGARDVADLLRLVPGFQTSTSFETGAPLASYHGAFDGYSARMQVLVDGRSVYSPYLIGGTGPGLQTVALSDIERIEVLRGSNSAAYGARAMLGVINIVTRHTLDTLGVRAGLGAGENGIRDVQASTGWNTGAAGFRLSLDRRGDDGLPGSNGHNRINRVNLRADLSASARDDVQLRAGGFTIDSGKGFVNKVDDALRERAYDSAYAQLDWRRSLDVDEDVALSVSHSQERYRESFPFVPLPGLTLDYSGRAQNDKVSVQHTARHGADVRLVLGAEFTREQIVSKPLYNTDAPLITDFTRLFGNLEWRAKQNLILNAGAMAEKSSVSGSTFAPRVMLNWHLTPAQTLRVGVSRAYRPPSAFEQFGDVRYSLNGIPLQVVTLARGNIQPESVLVREMGYLGDFPSVHASVDVRAFHERIGSFVRRQRYVLPAGTTHFPSTPWDYINAENVTIQGLEYQLKWQPWRNTSLVFSQAFTDIDSIDPGTVLAAPERASTLTWTQKLPAGIELSLMHQDSGKVRLTGSSNEDAYPFSRTDLRLGLPLRFGSRRGEVALVVQNLGSSYQDFAPQFRFERRAFLTLRVEN